jgi:transcriptional regulator with AAA-type ATPase domain
MANKFLPESDRTILELLGELAYTNPFHPRRKELEREILGDRYQDPKVGEGSLKLFSANLEALHEVTSRYVESARKAFYTIQGTVDEWDFRIYHRVVYLHLFSVYRKDFQEYILRRLGRIQGVGVCGFYKDFSADYARFFPLRSIGLEPRHPPEVVFSIIFQLRRAFFHIFEFIVGSSPAANRLRARVWQSIFTHNMGRYQRSLYNRMGDIVTFITGPSGTGKELVARAIGLSRYIPFDPDTLEFFEDFPKGFVPVNLTALSETLLESELFGHRKGSFTGALQDRKGYLETCGEYGTILLDEITETHADIQVKLLRVLQTRHFQRLGDTRSLPFHGKFMAASNRDLAVEMREGRFREDFYYRLCSDRVHTVALREILQESPEELRFLVNFISRRIAGEEESSGLTEEACDWIEENLSLRYSWPGNFRELEQCVRNVMLHGEYIPENTESQVNRTQLLTNALGSGNLSAERFLSEYVSSVYERTGNYKETARLLDMDRRTVKKYTELIESAIADQKSDSDS